MEYCFLIWRDTSGRGEKGMLRFENEKERETYLRETLLPHIEPEELENAICTLKQGGQWHDDDERTEYEYM